MASVIIGFLNLNFAFEIIGFTKVGFLIYLNIQFGFGLPNDYNARRISFDIKFKFIVQYSPIGSCIIIFVLKIYYKQIQFFLLLLGRVKSRNYIQSYGLKFDVLL